MKTFKEKHIEMMKYDFFLLKVNMYHLILRALFYAKTNCNF